MFVIDRSLYLSPEVVGEPGLRPLKEVDPFSLEALVAWLEKQPGGTKYDYLDCGACLLSRFAKTVGHKYESVIVLGPDDLGSEEKRMEWIACEAPYIYSAALSRARKLLAEREK